VLPLTRLLLRRTMRESPCCIKAMVSSSRLSGRGGRRGGGPSGLIKGTVMGFSGMGGLEY
jgi:hypothetical protein